MTEEEAFNLEIQLIREVGRFELKQGPLTNLTAGGEGSSGVVYSETRREKKRQAQLGRKLSETTKEKIRQARLGKKRSEETREKIRQAHLGKKCSEETREKIRQAHLGRSGGGMFGRTHSEETKEKIRQTQLKKHSEKKIAVEQALYRKTP